MSSLSELLPPRPAPEIAARAPDPSRGPSARSNNDDDFSSRLEKERSAPSDRSEDTRASKETRETDDSRQNERSERSEDSRAEAHDEPSKDARQSDRQTDERGDEPASSDEQSAKETSQTSEGVEETSQPSSEETDNAAATLVQNTIDLSLIADDVVNTDLTVTALSGEAISLTPPAAIQTNQAQPGALGRWFSEAAGPAGQSGPAAQLAGLLNQQANVPGKALNPTPATATGPGAIDADGAGQSMQTLDGAQSPDLNLMNNAAGKSGTQSLADALSSSNASSQDFADLLSQVFNKTANVADIATNATPTPTGQTIATGAQTAATAVPQSSTGQAVPVTALAVEITRQATNGKTQFEIRLDPPELGRLNVRLEVDANGQTRTHLVVERSETLDMLATDARSLERALQQAGLKTEPGSVSFELAQDFNENLAQNDQNTDANSDENGSNGEEDGAGDTSALNDDPNSTTDAIRQRLYLSGQLDLRV